MRCGLYGSTRKFTLLFSVPLGVTTSIFPVVAPVGTVVVINEPEFTVNAAGVPLKVTLVAPVRLVPSILTAYPPAGGRFCFHKRYRVYGKAEDSAILLAPGHAAVVP